MQKFSNAQQSAPSWRLMNRAAKKKLTVNHGGLHTLIGCVNDGLE